MCSLFALNMAATSSKLELQSENFFFKNRREKVLRGEKYL